MIPHQRWLRIIPVALLMYTISFVDRTNISMALPSMSRDLHMDPAQAGNVAGVFFWGYLLLQIPAGHLANSWSAKRLISIFLVVWGTCAVGCGLVHTWRELWVMRLLLGLAEGGVWPVMLVFLSHWFPRKERARANALWMLCLPIAVIFSSPFSGWVLDHWNWRVMMIAEGALPFIWLVVWQAVIYDHPYEAKWLPAAEREYLETALEREAVDHPPFDSQSFLRALVQPQVLLLTLICFLRNIADFGFLIWLPSAVENATKLTNTEVGELVTIPFIVAIVLMVLNAWHSDKSGERRNHASMTFAIGGIALLTGVLLSRQWPTLAFTFVCLTTAGTEGILGPFWAIPTETLPQKVAGPAMGLINALGSFGAFFGAVAVGYLDEHIGGFRYGFGFIGIDLLFAALLCLLLNPARRSTDMKSISRGSGKASAEKEP
ncbi:MAG TPA: MFS transporter [Terriglobia bacterium]|nr:MFS transporter [Terriglobia bacterium]